MDLLKIIIFSIQAQNAFNNGMVGMILYSDPEDKGKGQV